MSREYSMHHIASKHLPFVPPQTHRAIKTDAIRKNSLMTS